MPIRYNTHLLKCAEYDRKVGSPMPLLADVITTPNKAIHSAFAKPTSRKPAADNNTAKKILKLQ